MTIDLASLTDTVSNGLSGLMDVVSDPVGAVTAATAVSTTAKTAGTSAVTGTGGGLSLFVKSSPIALITAHPVLILLALGGGLGIVAALDALGDFRDGKRANLAAPSSQPEQVQKA